MKGLNKDFALIWIEISAYKHIRKNRLCLCYWLVYTCILLWKALNRFVCVCKMSCTQNRSLHTRLKTGAVTVVIQSSEKNICAENGNPDSLLDYPILCGTVGDSCHTTGWVPDTLLHICTKMWFFHLHLSPKQCECVFSMFKEIFNLVNQSSLRAQLSAWSEIILSAGLQKPVLFCIAIMYCNIT